jgi:murein DD-endopeptidase MepM/ murein hydrolase activator NlpD
MTAVPDAPRAGDPVTVGVAVPANTEAPPVYAVLVNGQGRRLSRAAFFALPGSPNSQAAYTEGTRVLAAVLAIPSTLRPGKVFIRTEPPIEGLEDLSLTVMERDFVSETIDLNENNTRLRTEEDAQKIVEAEQLWAILRRKGDTVYTQEAFKAPVDSTRRTSFFGDRRLYRYIDGSTDTAIHAGIDYGVPRGTTVRACAPGRVVLARFRIVTGNSVIIEHLPGLYSLYYHLDTLAVTEGSLVDKSGVLGESGATGLATGPHLHWEIRAAGEIADPDVFIERPILDKTAILSMLFE